MGASKKHQTIIYFENELDFRNEMLRLTLNGEIINIMYHGNPLNICGSERARIRRYIKNKLENKWFIIFSEVE